ncbi:hypothetical protein ERJ75_000655600 [Trypanosoma vivax]|nr:hypothetical protein ERJ75_000655600 [Trypanosoma vivax]
MGNRRVGTRSGWKHGCLALIGNGRRVRSQDGGTWPGGVKTEPDRVCGRPGGATAKGVGERNEQTDAATTRQHMKEEGRKRS